MEAILNNVVGKFNFEGEFIEAEPFNFGHINDTYLANFRDSSGQTSRYIVQRINHNVFKVPEKVMENIIAITGHLREKILSSGGNPVRETLNFIPTIDGDYFYQCQKSGYWRAYIFIDQAKTYQVVKNPEYFYCAGKAFGKFQKLLSDFPAETLHETIPDFHNTPKRLDALFRAVEKDSAGRVEKVLPELQFIRERADEASIIIDLLNQKGLPLRVVHNDTKFNNVLIDDNTCEGICVIDLDTVMPGTSLFDFGDSIRSGANTTYEDERDLSKVHMDLGLFEQFTKGYLEYTGCFLTPTELQHIPFSTKLMALELGTRFLTDYLEGDTYFKVQREDHNLDRARVQLKLAADMESKQEQMKEIVNKYK